MNWLIVALDVALFALVVHLAGWRRALILATAFAAVILTGELVEV